MKLPAILKLLSGVLAIVCFATPCQKHSFESAEALRKHILDKDNGFQIGYQLGNNEVKVNYEPTDLWVERELDKENTCDLHTVDLIREKYRPYVYFKMVLSKDNRAFLQSALPEYGKLLNTLSFRMHDYAYLTCGKDTVELLDFHLQHLYGIGKSNDILLVFSREALNGQDDVVLHLKEFGGKLGNLSFPFANSKIINEPHLNFINFIHKL